MKSFKFNKNRFFKYLRSVIAAILVLISISMLILSLNGLEDQKLILNNYYKKEGIEFHSVKISVPSSQSYLSREYIYGNLYLPNDTADKADGSVPIVVFVPGANNGKHNHFEKHYNLVKRGIAVLALEQRGHFQSGSFFTLYNEEPRDISRAIDFIELNYPKLNTTHVGLIGLSLGGGASVFAQVFDDRIYCSSIWHPFANVSIPFVVDLSTIIGFLPGMKNCVNYSLQRTYFDNGIFPNWDRVMNDTFYNLSAVNFVTPQNTKNLLIIQGTNDHTINYTNSIELVKRAGGLNASGQVDETVRDDVKLLLRDGLDHGENEHNNVSVKSALVWLEHFLINGSIDIQNLDQEILYFELLEANLPEFTPYLDGMNTPFIIFIIAMFILLYRAPYARIPDETSEKMLILLERVTLINKIKDSGLITGKNEGSGDLEVKETRHMGEGEGSHGKSGNYPRPKIKRSGLDTKLVLQTDDKAAVKILKTRTLVFFLGYLYSAVIFMYFNHSLTGGLVLYPYFVIIPYFVFFDSKRIKKALNLTKAGVSNEKSDLKDSLYNLGFALIAIILPVLGLIFTHNLVAEALNRPVIPFFFNYWVFESIRYISCFSFMLISPLLLMKDLDLKFTKYLIPIEFFSSLIFTVFIKISIPGNPAFQSIPPIIISLAISLVLGIIFLLLFIVIKIVSTFLFRNDGYAIYTILVISFVISILLQKRFMRLL